MARWEYPIPENARASAGDMVEHLISSGIPVTASGVTFDRETQQSTFWVDSVTDPTAAVQSFAAAQGQFQTGIDNAIGDGQALFKLLIKKPRAQRTDTEKMLLGLAAQVWKDKLR